MRPYGICALFVLAGCTALPSASKEEVGTASSPIINGRPSGDDENAAVFIVTEGEVSPLHCSGRLIAPGLVLTARHCLIKRKVAGLRCNADGSPIDIVDAVDTRLEPVEQMKVYIGSNKNAMRVVAVKQALATLDVTICRSDLAYLVLEEPGLDARTPIRRALPQVGESISVSGWGYVDDTQRTKLPDTRATVETKIMAIGPNSIPSGTFAVQGGTLCLGDSGANALTDGAVVGVYTRIDGDSNACVTELARNILASVMSDTALLTKAFSAIGEEPWFAGEERPWLAPAGAGCTSDDECRSGTCDQGGTCRPGCGPTKLACHRGEDCAIDGQTCVPTPPPANGSDGGTNASPESGTSSSCGVAPRSAPSAPEHGAHALVLVYAALALRRGRRCGPTTGARRART